jgi:hypothetical protein
LIQQISNRKILPFNRPSIATSFLPLIITGCNSLSVFSRLVYALFSSFWGKPRTWGCDVNEFIIKRQYHAPRKEITSCSSSQWTAVWLRWPLMVRAKARFSKCHLFYPRFSVIYKIMCLLANKIITKTKQNQNWIQEYISTCMYICSLAIYFPFLQKT